MKTEIKILIRAFHVRIRDERTGEEKQDVIVLDKPRLQAGHVVGLNSEEMIYRAYNRRGFRVLEIGKVDKRELCIDLHEQWANMMEAEAKNL